ncbi:hypothetical protein LTR53_013882 [Teratosphaeriaceae sp. CCFEE 6253]|nr:hypothetical protein LTR53_013882 [Teratosphaeriaceae sp. CCFEE 6253]
MLERLRRLEGVLKGLGVDVPPDREGTPTNKTEEVQGDRVLRAKVVDEEDVLQSEKQVYDAAATSPEEAQDLDLKAKTRYIKEQGRGRFENRFSRLVVNQSKSRYINNSFSANLSNEVEDLKGILNQSSDEEDDPEPSAHQVISSYQGYVFGFSLQNVDMLALHPLPGQTAAYWDVFKDRVDPVVKVLHIPTIEPTVLSAASHLPDLTRGFEALLFAI